MKYKICTEQGHLNDFGRQTFGGALDFPIEEILDLAENEQEVRLIGCLLSSYVANLVYDKKQQFKAQELIREKLWKMTDQEFEEFLDQKYGLNRNLVSLTPEEFERLPSISPERCKEIIQEGRKEAEDYYNANPPAFPNSSIRYR